MQSTLIKPGFQPYSRIVRNVRNARYETRLANNRTFSNLTQATQEETNWQ